MQPISQNSTNSDKLVTELLEIMKQLRDKDNGCPWDKQQTFETISKYTIEESEVGYKNFCIVEASIMKVEWLYLASKGHRRAKFTFKNNQVEKKWLIP